MQTTNTFKTLSDAVSALSAKAGRLLSMDSSARELQEALNRAGLRLNLRRGNVIVCESSQAFRDRQAAAKAYAYKIQSKV